MNMTAVASVFVIHRCQFDQEEQKALQYEGGCCSESVARILTFSAGVCHPDTFSLDHTMHFDCYP